MLETIKEIPDLQVIHIGTGAGTIPADSSAD
jgi:hypothetical protein